MRSLSRQLQESELPKLLFFASPGGLINAKTVEWCIQKLKNLEAINIGAGIHYLQEDNPHQIGLELASWYRNHFLISPPIVKDT